MVSSGQFTIRLPKVDIHIRSLFTPAAPPSGVATRLKSGISLEASDPESSETVVCTPVDVYANVYVGSTIRRN